jgi:hypothetical protein
VHAYLRDLREKSLTQVGSLFFHVMNISVINEETSKECKYSVLVINVKNRAGGQDKRQTKCECGRLTLHSASTSAEIFRCTCLGGEHQKLKKQILKYLLAISGNFEHFLFFQ